MSARADRLRAKVAAERALPASQRLANMLQATHTTADAKALLDGFRAEVLIEAADFFEGVLKDTLHPERDARYWSAVHDIVRGLRCRADGGESRG